MKSLLLALLLSVLLIQTGCKSKEEPLPLVFPTQENVANIDYAEPFSEGPTELPKIEGPQELPSSL